MNRIFCEKRKAGELTLLFYWVPKFELFFCLFTISHNNYLSDLYWWYYSSINKVPIATNTKMLIIVFLPFILGRFIFTKKKRIMSKAFPASLLSINYLRQLYLLHSWFVLQSPLIDQVPQAWVSSSILLSFHISNVFLREKNRSLDILDFHPWKGVIGNWNHQTVWFQRHNWLALNLCSCALNP